MLQNYLFRKQSVFFNHISKTFIIFSDKQQILLFLPISSCTVQCGNPSHESQKIDNSSERNRTSITVISDANVKFKFNAKKTFKTAILCVRFLVRLKRIKITPVLFSLDATRCNPYHMRNIRHSIGKLSDKVFLNTTQRWRQCQC